jgi:putative oxidoreductase
MRNLGRTLVILGLVGIIGSIAWWEASYDAAIRALGRNLKISHPLGCIVFTTDACAQAKATAVLGNGPAYTPFAFWIALAVVIVGLVLVYRSPPLAVAPVTPAGEPRLFIGRLEGFYAWVRDLAWPIVRIAAGGTILTHGVRKVMEGSFAAFAAGSMGRRGIDPSVAYLIYFNETIGAAMMMLGLLTRVVATSLAIEFAIVTYVVLPNGYVASNRGGGWAYTLLLGALCFAIALRGGGPYSLDRVIRREL